MLPLTPYDPDRIGPYPLTHRLGTGGMGQVYLGHTKEGSRVVVKVVRSALMEDDRLDGTDYRARFAREAELAARVGGRYTAEVVDSDPHSERPWIAYVHVPGPSLKEALTASGPLTPSSVRALATLLAEALRNIHDRDLIHRDIKPSNIILAPDGPRVIDFGIARPTEGSAMTGTGHVFGTLPYMSPEQAEGNPLSPASDLFALGTTLAQAATGDCPFDGPSEPRILMNLVSPPPLEALSGLPGDLRALIRDCWSHDPELRPTPLDVVERCTAQGLEHTWPPLNLGAPPLNGDRPVPPTEETPITEGSPPVEATSPIEETPTEPPKTTAPRPTAPRPAVPTPVPAHPVPVAVPPDMARYRHGFVFGLLVAFLFLLVVFLIL